MAHVLFRTAAGSGIGLGHAARCAALAVALRRRGHSVSGLVRGDGGVAALDRRGVPSHAAACPWVADVVAAVTATGSRAVVFDDYEYPESMIETTVRAIGATTLVLDDSGARVTAADAVWNGAPCAEASEDGARVRLLGLERAPATAAGRASRTRLLSSDATGAGHRRRGW